MEEEFVKQFQGSASANLIFVVAFMMYAGLKHLCQRDSKCKSSFHMCCCDIDVSDRTIHDDPISLDEQNNV